MATERQFENLMRESKIRKGIVIYGNTRDEFFVDGKYVLLPRYLNTLLKSNGFDIVGFWNSSGGLSFDRPSDSNSFKKWLQKGCKNDQDDSEEYDLGDSSTESGKDDLPPIKGFNEVIQALIPAIENHDRSCAFIMDWTDFRFGTIQSPMSLEDRQSLEMLSTLMTGVNGTGKPNNILTSPPCVVILISANLGSIPPLFYQPDSRIKLFNLTLPEKNTRASFFGEQLENMQINQCGRSRREMIDLLSDISEGMRTVDLIQIVKLAKDHKDLTPEKLFNLYRFGEKKSPWEDLSDEKLGNIKNTLKKRVIGQDHAVEYVETTIIKAAVGLSGIQHSAKMSKPKGVMFFVGPTGVGKTELAKATAEFLFGDENACIRFDMSEYSHEESDQRLIGAPPGYVGFEEGGQLINAILKRPFSVLLFDEIEKAHPRILDKFLQILEDGRLTDGRGVTAYFSESVIIFTSNIGASEVNSGQSFEEMERQYLSKVKEHFNTVLKRPELLNRIGNNVIVFNSITDKSLRKDIIKKKLKPLGDLIKEKYGVGMVIDEALYAYFEDMADSSHGGRGLLNAAETKLINPLSIYIFRNKQLFDEGRTITAKLNKNTHLVEFDIIEG